MTTNSLYTPDKLFHRLVEKLPVGEPTTVDCSRFSVTGDTAGAAAQMSAHLSTYAGHPAIDKIACLPEEAWDPNQPALGAAHGIRWLSLADLHHTVSDTSPVAAVTLVEDLLFLNVTLSATTKHIKRLDGEDENGFTRLLLGILGHYRSLKQTRFAEDVTRAGRDEADWAAILQKHRHKDVDMVFGGQVFQPGKQSDYLVLQTLGVVGGSDDPMRRRRLTGKRLEKYKNGGAAINEQQMPHGWGVRRDREGRPLQEGERGIVPVPNAAMIPVMQSLFAAHAAGETYHQILERMIAFEASGVLVRRDHNDRDNSYAATRGDGGRRTGAARSFFHNNSFRPAHPPSAEAIERYVAGADPVDVFDVDTRLFIAKVELVRTGRFQRRLKNDLRGRNIVLNGTPATYADERDEFGWFDVLSAPWAWPVDATGAEVARFGVPDHTLRLSAARLLRQLRAPRATGGGRTHHKQERRALQHFENWSVPPESATSRYDDEDTQWGIEARRNNSGKANFILMFRRASTAQSARGERGWLYVGQDEKRRDHIAATGSLRALCASVAHHLDAGIHDLLEQPDPPALAAIVPVEPRAGVEVDLSNSISRIRADRAALLTEADGHRTMAALVVAGGGPQAQAEAMAYSRQAAAAAHRADQLDRKLAQAERRLRAATESSDRRAKADVSVAAFLVAGLEKAALNNGFGPDELGKLCDNSLTQWRFGTEEQGDLRWSCTALLPLADGGHATLPLSGRVANVRQRPGKTTATASSIVRHHMEEGRTLDELAELLSTTRRTLLVKRVMPWLREHSVVARGAKCALVDHPLPEVRRAIHAAVTDQQTPGGIVTPYLRHLTNVYLDPDLMWGDAAVPDDTRWIQDVISLIEAEDDPSNGAAVLDLALAVGRTERQIRSLVKPQRRSAGGFTRPRYLAYADPEKTRVTIVACPHGRCQGRGRASHVVLLPEVAVSGFGVICRACRRAPKTNGHWATIQFPAAYLTRWTNVKEGNLRTCQQTARA